MKHSLWFAFVSSFCITSESSEILYTTRLVAHRIQREDFDNLYTLLSNPEVGKTILGGVHNYVQTNEALNLLLARWLKNKYGSWMFHDKKNGAFIGRAGLHPAEIENNTEIILSYAILPEYWNMGYATEMAQAVVKQGFTTQGFESIVGFTQPTNEASKKVLMKSGFTYEKNIAPSEGRYKGVELVFYRFKNDGSF